MLPSRGFTNTAECLERDGSDGWACHMPGTPWLQDLLKKLRDASLVISVSETCLQEKNDIPRDRARVNFEVFLGGPTLDPMELAQSKLSFHLGKGRAPFLRSRWNISCACGVDVIP